MSDEETRALLRAYVALTLAQEAAQRCAEAAASHPCFMALVNNQGLALRELDGLLERAFAEAGDAPAVPGAADDCAALLM